jgi:hypothetical protein
LITTKLGQILKHRVHRGFIEKEGCRLVKKVHRRATKYAEEAQREGNVRRVLSLNRNRIGRIASARIIKNV